MRPQHIAPIAEGHFPVRLYPDLVPRVRGYDIQRRDVKAEFARLGELADAGAQGEEVGPRDGGGEVGDGEGAVVDSGVVKAEDGLGLRLGLGRGGGGSSGGRGDD